VLLTEQIHAAFADDIRRWFARRVPADVVDDRVQETFLRIHGSLGDLRDETRLAPWVFRVCRSVLVDHARRERPTESLDLQSDAILRDDALDDLSEQRATATVASWLLPFIETLPEGQREAVRLSEIEGLSQVEVAERLGLSKSGARTRVQRGRAALRVALEDCCRIGFADGEVVSIEPRCDC
jgi:RNA polymerase sigma-70 factor (ECF subfamily)